MNIAGMTYSLKDKALDIFLAGCTIGCRGCHNPEAQDFKSGKPYDVVKLADRIRDGGDLIERVRIMGGEPFDQNLFVLDEMLHYISACHNVELWLFTGYMPDELTEFQKKIISKYCDYVKYGRYDNTLEPIEITEFNIILASANQTVSKVKQ